LFSVTSVQSVTSEQQYSTVGVGGPAYVLTIGKGRSQYRTDELTL